MALPRQERPRLAWLAAGVFYVSLLAGSLWVVFDAWWRGALFRHGWPLLYQAGTLSFNYVEFGAIRRGLGGTLAIALSPDRLLATAAFHALSYACLAAIAVWLLVRMRRPLAERIVFALLFVALTARWAEDAGRTDVLVAALLAGAAVALLRCRFAVACACVGVGLAVHETAFIFGLPLLLALGLDHGRWRAWSLRSRAIGVAILAIALAAYLLIDRLPHADVHTMVETVRGHLPRHELVDWAIYFAVGGARGVRTSLCQNAGDPNYWVHLVTGLVLIALFTELLRPTTRAPRALCALAALPPYLFLNVVANDVSRWAMLAALGVWLLQALRAVETRAPATAPRPWPRWLVAALVVPLIHPRVLPIPTPFFAPMPPVERLLIKLGGPPTPTFAEVIERCDPRWREVLDPPPSR